MLPPVTRRAGGGPMRIALGICLGVNAVIALLIWVMSHQLLQ
jgi:hypothetical protein